MFAKVDRFREAFYGWPKNGTNIIAKNILIMGGDAGLNHHKITPRPQRGGNIPHYKKGAVFLHYKK